MRKFLAALALLATMPAPLLAQRLTDDKDLVEMDLTKWDCKDLGGTAKSQEGIERNQGKNRGMVDLSRLNIPNLDTAGFLKAVGAFEAQVRGSTRKDLSYAQKIQLAGIERQIVSLTGYLVLAYPGPGETTNCGSVEFHDWHLEVFDKPLDHPPEIGDPTPIVCEITPRLQNTFYHQGIRLQDLARFMRRPDNTHEDNGHPARKVRFTGYLLWDDAHTGENDIGPLILRKAKNGYHQPWRASAFEIHPILKIEVLDGPPPGAAPAPAPPLGTAPAPTPGMIGETAAPPTSFSPPPVAPITPAPPNVVTILEPVKIKIPYGETVVPRGTRVEVVTRTAQTVTVRYLGQDVVVPLTSTDLR